MCEENILDLGEDDVAIIIESDGNMGLVLPAYSDNTFVGTNIQIAVGLFIMMRDQSFIDSVLEIFAESADEVFGKIESRRTH